ncbi:MAG: hypothetical protein JNK60_18695, partial [Acidobacteria bacterium]|nr:hypothetical protein [Acidobacteriota bacterium]
MRSRLILGLAVAVGAFCGAALSPLSAGPLPVPSKPRYVFQRMGEDVLGARTITALRQDREGFLWVGTSDGLFRFDGATLVRYGASEGLEGDAITFLAEAPDGTLFAVTNREVSWKRGDRFVRLPLPVPSERRRLRGQVLAFDARSRIYVATAAGLVRFPSTSDAGSLLGGLPEGQDPRVTAVTVLKNGTVLFFAGNDVFQLGGDGAMAERLAVEGGATGPASALLEDASGRVILRTSTRLYRRERPGEPFRSDDVGLPGANDLGTIALDRLGEALVPTPVGLYVKRLGRWEAIDRTRGLASNAVLAVCEDREGALWIGYGGGGLERWPG